MKNKFTNPEINVRKFARTNILTASDGVAASTQALKDQGASYVQTVDLGALDIIL